MEYRILGPLEVVGGNGPLDLGSPKQRALLAVLLIHANRVIALDAVIDELWGDEPPAKATSSLQAYISNLRKVLEPGRGPGQPAQVLVTQPPGYTIRIDGDALDASRFERLLSEGRRLLAEDDVGAARSVLRDALALWRGPALVEFSREPFATGDSIRLNELRASAEEDVWETDLALDRSVDVVPE